MKSVSESNLALRKNLEIFKNLPHDLKQLRKSAREEILSLLKINPGENIFMTGHQPIIFHPGILKKEIDISSAAKSIGGKAITLVNDTEITKIILNYPCADFEKDHVIKNNFSLGTAILSRPSMISQTELEIKFSIMSEKLANLLPDEQLRHITNASEKLIRMFSGKSALRDIITNCRLDDLEEKGFQLYSLNLSAILKTYSWKKYTSLILNVYNDFFNSHNLSLKKYRTEHNIKNHAQPLPDLADNELPFWNFNLKSGQRKKIVKNDSVEAVSISPESDEALLPRALSLTIFLRLFFADIFIHGIGGGRYDKITDSIMTDIWRFQPPDYIISTKTLEIPLKQNSLIQNILRNKDENILKGELWKLKCKPELFFQNDLELNNKIKFLIEKIENTDKKSREKKELHFEIINLRKKLIKINSPEYGKLENKIRASILSEPSKKNLLDRSYPYFFYKSNEVFF